MQSARTGEPRALMLTPAKIAVRKNARENRGTGTSNISAHLVRTSVQPRLLLVESPRSKYYNRLCSVKNVQSFIYAREYGLCLPYACSRIGPVWAPPIDARYRAGWLPLDAVAGCASIACRIPPHPPPMDQVPPRATWQCAGQAGGGGKSLQNQAFTVTAAKAASPRRTAARAGRPAQTCPPSQCCP